MADGALGNHASPQVGGVMKPECGHRGCQRQRGTSAQQLGVRHRTGDIDAPVHPAEARPTQLVCRESGLAGDVDRERC